MRAEKGSPHAPAIIRFSRTAIVAISGDEASSRLSLRVEQYGHARPFRQRRQRHPALPVDPIGLFLPTKARQRQQRLALAVDAILELNILAAQDRADLSHFNFPKIPLRFPPR
ncbi:hypothetical protein LZK73_34730 (plasmid) [Neorhizobium galegae]|nr:hypothetical protein LZK73_34730 [Neorhizobium galegae]